MSRTSMTSGSSSRLLVSSRMMTQTETVILIDPPSREAAPSTHADISPIGCTSQYHRHEEARRSYHAIAEDAEKIGGDEEEKD
ncbi:unnamed protein product [Spirodela intermedia]|uniref:Uncharacterized protein n=2 Tax=Spirodela intermedia TaxID=51605 RepID=A0A7I8IUL0_SPIIN|nr:unnamed protein product [Spirodela intermedia]CAA6661459.1 unnamed protein product [Spirodela intermedia]CAA7397820.1 unnamed protein product [Spirodela intermedia]